MPSARVIAALTVVLCAVLLLPFALVEVPPLLDYPNHLARAVVLAAGSDDPVLARMVAPRWGIIPNLWTDLVLPPLLRVLPVHLAGRIVAGVTLLLPVLGTIAYGRALFGRWSLWPLAVVLVAYNGAFLFGFLNFVAASGLALLLAAAWIAGRERHPILTIAAATVGTAALFFCHLLGVVCFALLVAGSELTRFRARPMRCLGLLPPLGVAAALYLVSPLAPAGGVTEYRSVGGKAYEVLQPFANYLLPLDIATACAVVLCLLACLACRRCRVSPAGALSFGLAAVLFLAAPRAFKGTYDLDTRFAILLGFLLFAVVQPTALPRWATVSMAVAFGVLFIVRMGVVLAAWNGHAADVTALRAAMAPVQPGERVLVTFVSPDDAPDYWRHVPLSRRLSTGSDPLDRHMPALLLIERRAFWPFLFASPSQQPVRLLPPYDGLAARANAFASHRDALTAAELCDYDAVLLLDAGGEPNLPRFISRQMSLVHASDFAALFRVQCSAHAGAATDGFSHSDARRQ